MYLTNASISALFRRIELFAALSGLFFAHNSLKINCFHHWDGLYVGGRVDSLIQRSIEIINSFPQIPLWLVLAALVPPDWSPLHTYFAITIVLSLLNWTGLARVVRGKLLSLREEDYAVAARLIGAGHSRIIFRHLVPGFTSHIIVSLTLSVPAMILGETALSFLALGLRPPVVSWGRYAPGLYEVSGHRGPSVGPDAGSLHRSHGPRV